MKLIIIGLGPGGEAWLPQAAKAAGQGAQVEYNSRNLSLKDLIKALETSLSQGLVTACYVSGDPGFYSLAKTLQARFGETYEVEIYPGLSSVSYLAASLGRPWQGAHLMSCHGRPANLVAAVAYHEEVYALTGGNLKDLLHDLCQAGLQDLPGAVGENLSLPQERILRGSLGDLKKESYQSLAVLYVRNPNYVDPTRFLKDEDFSRGPVPMTKEEVRSVILAKLNPEPAETWYDIGAGTGSVAIALARGAHAGRVYAIEQKEAALALIEENRQALGAYNVEVIAGRAPTALADLPKPDGIFIGGSEGALEEIIRVCLEKNPKLKLGITAVSLQGLAGALDYLKAQAGIIKHQEIISLTVAKAKRLGRYDLMEGQNPTWLILVEFQEESACDS